MTGRRQTRIRTYINANIKGTPAMRAAAVGHDLRILQAEASLLGLQEFRWPWYWRTAKRLLAKVRRADRWRSSPGFDQGLARPVVGAQAVLWLAMLWRRKDFRVQMLHEGVAGISEDRFIRAALVVDRETEAPGKVDLETWVASTHCVVGGDMPGDSPRRKAILEHDLDVIDEFLGDLVRTGKPVIFGLDANIRRASGASYERLRRIVSKHGGRIVGAHGVEFIIVIDGKQVGIDVVGDGQIGTDRLKTDHEARVLRFRLYEKA